jgi:TolB-like protein
MRYHTVLMKIRAALTMIVFALIAVVAQAANLTDTATSIGQTLATDLSSKRIAKVAIVDVVNTAGGITAFSRLLTEEVTNAIARSGKVTVIDRLYLDRILREQNLTLSGLVSDVNAVQQVGKIAGIDALVVGSYFELGSSVRVSMKALDVKTAQVLSSTTASIDLEVALTDLLKTPISSPVASGGGNSGSTAANSGKPANATSSSKTNVKFVKVDPNYRLSKDSKSITVPSTGNYRYDFQFEPQIDFSTIDILMQTNKEDCPFEIYLSNSSGGRLFSKRIQIGSKPQLISELLFPIPSGEKEVMTFSIDPESGCTFPLAFVLLSLTTR